MLISYLILLLKRARQINRCLVTANLRRPQIKQDTASNEWDVVQNQYEHHIILTKYKAVHPTIVSENYSSSGMLIIFIKVQTECILSIILLTNSLKKIIFVFRVFLEIMSFSVCLPPYRICALFPKYRH